jgi:glycosyltransferase involved in cell wall biosynthesis
MNILIVDSIRVWAGAQRFIVETATGLTARGHRVVVQTSPGSPLAARAREHGLPVSEVSTRVDAAPWTIVPLALKMRRNPYDVLLTTWDKDLRTSGLAARLAGRDTVVIHSRECDDPIKNKPRHRWFYNRVADHIFVNSRATLDTTLRSAPWLDEKRTSIVYKGIDLARYERLEPQGWRSQMAPDGSHVVIGFAGQLVARKRIDVLMEALASPQTAGLPWRLVIAGQGQDERQLYDHAQRLGIEDRVVFCGWVEDLHHWMAAIDVFVLPSLIEGFGYVLAEAAAASKPCVAYRASSVPEVVVEGETALLATPGRDSELADHLARLIGDRELRETMGAAARRDAFARHGLQTMVERIEERMLTLLRK